MICTENLKKLPVGFDDFKKIRENHFYYVDKTQLIEHLLQKWGEVNLFTRPRRFGKTLNMSMLKNFFEIGTDETLFEGLYISENQKLCEEYMGKYPVIFLSMKDVDGLTYDEAENALIQLIGSEAARFPFLLNSDKLSETEKEQYRGFTIIQNGKYCIDKGFLISSLKVLAQLLYKHYGQNTIILIDEYDVPLDKAFQHGYYREMVTLIRGLFGEAFKTNDFLQFAVLTGCLRISKESIFTGTNNFVADTIADERFSSFFGFTDEEVRKLLENTGNLEYFDWIKKWYDGYCFGKTEIYCPWDVLCYLNKLAFESESEPENFWENTSHNDIIRTFLSCEGMDVTDSFEKLLADETIEVNITENLTYEKLTDLEENLWSVLYLTGYLTKDIKNPVSGKTKAFLKIPNAEIMDIFRKSVVRWFDERIAVRDRSELFKALWNEDAGRLSDLILELLFETISYHDYAESFYHAF